jgi:hypothetical protein
LAQRAAIAVDSAASQPGREGRRLQEPSAPLAASNDDRRPSRRFSSFRH